MAHAHREDARRREEGRHWPRDPWRGGFGPRVDEVREREQVRRRELRVIEGVDPARGGGSGRQAGGRPVGEWLRGNGLA